ncbi:MAG: hypothetical protein M3Y50_00455 [Acidobacteriota bacterium]|nr:hypothetical protein [Acidobacteriota bacterium]
MLMTHWTLGATAIWMQQQESSSFFSTKSTLLTVFVALVALAMLGQAVALIVMAVGVSKAAKRGMAILEEVRGKAMPLIDQAHSVVRDTAPKVKVITENLVETTHMVRGKAQEFDATASDINAKTKAQVARVNGIVTSVLNSTAEVTETVQRGIKIPLREVSGVVNGLKAGLDVLVGRTKGFSVPSSRIKRDDEASW